MYNCYNEALNYLIGRYGKQEVPISRFNNKTATTYKPGKPVKLPNGETVFKMSDDDQQVEALIRQYNLGMAPKKELYYKLLSMGVIKEAVA